MEAYLQSESLWGTVKAVTVATDKTATIAAGTTDESKIVKARGKIVFAIDPIVYANVRNLKTTKEIWDKL